MSPPCSPNGNPRSSPSISKDVSNKDHVDRDRSTPSDQREDQETAPTETVAKQTPAPLMQPLAQPPRHQRRTVATRPHQARQLPALRRQQQVRRPTLNGSATDAVANTTTKLANTFLINARNVAQWATRDIIARNQQGAKASSPWSKIASSLPHSPIRPRAPQSLAPRCDSQARVPEARTSGAKRTLSRTPVPTILSSMHHSPVHRASSFIQRTLAVLSVSTTRQSVLLAPVK